MNSILIKLKALSKTDIAAIVLMAIAFLYMFISASFEGTISDEAFYISVPMRLINGDGLFTDEWHLSQLSSVLLYLPVKFFVSVTGGTQGIILFMRRLFCLFQLAVGAYTYKSLKKEGVCAVIISLAFMLYSVIGLRTFSYNTLGIGILLTICATVYTLFEKPSLLKMFFSGVLIAMFILCQPVGVIFYLIYFIAVCVFAAKGIKNKNTPYPFTPEAFLMTVTGIIPVFIFFLYLLLKNSDISAVIKCIPGILSDPEHMEVSDTLGIETFSGLQFFSDMTMAAGLIPLIIAFICIIISVIIRKKDKNFALIVSSAGTFVFILTFYIRLFFTGGTTETDDINFFFFPLALAGLAFYLISDKKNRRAFIIFLCTGMMYALFMTVSSNLRLHASVNGYILASFGTLILAKDLINELKNETSPKKSARPALISLAVSVFFFSVFNIGACVCHETVTRASFNSAKMASGIYSGITLPSDQALAYTLTYKDAQQIKEILTEDDKLFVLENIPAVYLDGDFRMGAFSGWFIAEQLGTSEVRERFRKYYEIFPENVPDYIYVPAYLYTEHGLKPTNPKKFAEFAYALFDGSAEDIGSGILIRVTGLKNE